MLLAPLAAGKLFNTLAEHFCITGQSSRDLIRQRNGRGQRIARGRMKQSGAQPAAGLTLLLLPEAFNITIKRDRQGTLFFTQQAA